MKKPALILLAACVFTSALSQISAPDFHKKVMELVKEKKVTVLNKTASACLEDSSIYRIWNQGPNVWENNTRVVYGYDWALNINSFSYSNWNTNSWTSSFRSTSVYDGYRNTISSLNENWNQGSNTWKNSNRSSFTYTNINLQTLAVYENWDLSTNSWINSFKISSTYDALSNMLSQVQYTWNPGTNMWQNTSLYTCTYTGTNVITQTWQLWDLGTNGYVNDGKATSTYDSNNNAIGYLWQNWNASNSSWENAYNAATTYSGNHMTQVIETQWNTTNNTWVNSSKGMYTYDANFNMTLNVQQQWLISTSTWHTNYQRNSIYNSQDQLTGETIMVLNSSNILTNNSRFTYNYDSNNNMVNSVTEMWNNSAWVNNSSEANFFNCTTVGINETAGEATGFVIYPNPAQDEIFIRSSVDFHKVQVINPAGQIIFAGENIKSIPVSHFAKGIYFIRLADKDNTVLKTEKFIKE